MKFGRNRDEYDVQKLVKLAVENLGEITEGFIIGGYTKRGRRKFLIRFAPGLMTKDALHGAWDATTTWFGEDPEEQTMIE